MIRLLAIWSTFAGAILVGLAIWQGVAGAFRNAAALGGAGAILFVWGGKTLARMEQAHEEAAALLYAADGPPRFSIHRGFDPGPLPQIAALLAADPRFEQVVEEEGSDDDSAQAEANPDWYALHVQCAPEAGDFDEARAAIEALIRAHLGEDALDAVTVQGY